MLKMTKIKLELITDPHMYVFFERCIREEFLLFLIDIVKPFLNI